MEQCVAKGGFIVSILKILGVNKAHDGMSKAHDDSTEGGSAETDTVRGIIRALEGMDRGQARYTASFAFILSRVAHADLKISEEEMAAMEKMVREVGGMPEEQAILVVQMAKMQSQLFGGTENFLVTREFNRIATPEQKFALLECLFGVASADNSVSTVESNEVRRISKELLLSHSDYVAARSAYRDYLAVLKDGPKPKS